VNCNISFAINLEKYGGIRFIVMFALTLDNITTRWVIIVTSRKTPLLKSLTTCSLEIISQINQPVSSVFLLKKTN
jgi:hypothetical protein